MIKTSRKTTVAGLILALLLTVVGFGGAAIADPAGPPIPGEDYSGWPVDGSQREYEYESVAYLVKMVPWGDPRLEIDELDELDPHTEYLFGTPEHLLARWYKYLRGRAIGLPKWNRMTPDERQAKWENYRDHKYVELHDSRTSGNKYAEEFFKEYELAARGYRTEKTVTGTGRFDAFPPPDEPLIIENKLTNKAFKPRQATKYARYAVKQGKQVAYVMNEVPSQDVIDEIAAINKTMLEEGAAQAPILATPRKWFATMKPVPHPNAPPDASAYMPDPTSPTGPLPTDSTGAVAADGQTLEPSSSTEALADSPDSQEDLDEITDLVKEIETSMGRTPADESTVLDEQLGGVDFSTLELRYVSDTYDGGLGAGVGYAYQVEPAPGREVSFGGRESAQLAADAFFTWLALPPESFTVNLNPDEPDRIIDEKFGKTDAGRVLLEADLEMKKTVAKLIHPDSERGADYWEALRGETKCISMRQWIVPKTAVVRENGAELFILDAPLEVKMETEYLQTKGVGGDAGCSGQSTADTDYNESVYRREILPELEKAVNEAPEYADLRRVYTSRVAAEWYRQRSETKATAYSDIIDSGDASAWPLRLEWDPRETFDRYVKSYTEGEFNIERTTRDGAYLVTYLYVYGGVNFASVPSESVSEAEFAARHPGLAEAVNGSLRAPTLGADGAGMWFGGQSTQRPPWDPFPEPASPLGNPLFYALAALPVLGWLVVGGYLWRRWRPSAAASSPGPVAS